MHAWIGSVCHRPCPIQPPPFVYSAGNEGVHLVSSSAEVSSLSTWICCMTRHPMQLDG